MTGGCLWTGLPFNNERIAVQAKRKKKGAFAGSAGGANDVRVIHINNGGLSFFFAPGEILDEIRRLDSLTERVLGIRAHKAVRVRVELSQGARLWRHDCESETVTGDERCRRESHSRGK